jgi:hypothetical protein
VSIGVKAMIESFALFLGPVFGACTGFEMSCIFAGVFFSASYLLVLGLWIIASQTSSS